MKKQIISLFLLTLIFISSISSFAVETETVLEFQEVVALQEENGDFNITGILINNGEEELSETMVSVLKGSDILKNQEFESIGAGGQINFEFTIESELIELPQTEIILEAESEEFSTTYEIILVNEKILEDIMINGGNSLLLYVGEKKELEVEFSPITATVGEYTLSVEDTSIAKSEELEITAEKEGVTKITVQHGDIKKEIDLIVMRDNEIKSLKAYFMDGDEKVVIPFDKDYEYNTYSGYVLNLNNDITRIGFEVEAAETTQVSVYKADDSKKKILLDQYSEISVPILGYTRVLFDVKSTESINEYEVIINFKPEVTNYFPSELVVYTGLECETEITEYFNDKENDKNLRSIKFVDENNEELGNVEMKDDKKVYWTYTSEEDMEIEVKFILTDRLLAETVADVTIISMADEEKPTWQTSSEPKASNITANSATIKWNRASDNDIIESYTLYYYDKIARIKSRTINAAEDITPQIKLTGLYSGTEYKIYVEATDRSGNVTESKIGEFRTLYAESGSPGGGGSGGGSGGGVTVVPQDTPAPTTRKFEDLSNFGWAENEINSLVQRGVIKGISETLYAPENNITRADFITLLVRGLNLNSEFDGNFNDVSDSSYYYETVGVARALGIITGSGNGLFLPEENITRQDMIVMTTRALQHLGKITITMEGQPFTDDENIAGYAKQSVYSLSEAGIIKGDQNRNVMPLSFTTRAEAAVIIYRVIAP